MNNSDYEITYGDIDFLLNESSTIIYGESGIGKTTIARNLPDPLYLMLRGGGEHRPAPLAGTGIPFIEITNKAQIDRFILDAREGLPRVMRQGQQPKTLHQAIQKMTQEEIEASYQPKFLVVDQLTSLYDIFMNDVLDTISRKREPETPNQQDYGQARRRILDFMMELSKLSSFHKVYLCLEEVDTDPISGERKGLPMLAGKLAREISRFVDFMFRMHLRREVQMVGGKPQVKEFHAFLTQPEGMWMAKDSTGKLPNVIELPDPNFNYWQFIEKEVTK